MTGLEKVYVFDKKVFLVDDITDSVKMILNIWSMLKDAGAKEVRTYVLLNKQDSREVDFKVDFVGFKIVNEFVVGYRLDDSIVTVCSLTFGRYRSKAKLWRIMI